MFSIWECKLQKTIPTVEKLENDVFFNMENIRKVSSALRSDILLNLHICRFGQPRLV
jgi:hypothetical protein